MYRLRTVPGIGKILSLVILYEIHNIERFKRPQELASYSRLVRCSRESAGKGKALTVLAHKLARAVYHIWKHDTVFDQERFLTH